MNDVKVSVKKIDILNTVKDNNLEPNKFNLLNLLQQRKNTGSDIKNIQIDPTSNIYNEDGNTNLEDINLDSYLKSNNTLEEIDLDSDINNLDEVNLEEMNLEEMNLLNDEIKTDMDLIDNNHIGGSHNNDTTNNINTMNKKDINSIENHIVGSNNETSVDSIGNNLLGGSTHETGNDINLNMNDMAFIENNILNEEINTSNEAINLTDNMNITEHTPSISTIELQDITNKNLENIDESNMNNENLNNKNINEYIDKYTFKGGGKSINIIKFEYSDNIMEDYNTFIKNYEIFYKEQHSKANKQKYTYTNKNNVLLKTRNKDGKKILEIHKPKYINIDEIKETLNLELNNNLYDFKNLRNNLIIEKSPDNIKKFKESKKKYLDLLDYKENINNYYNTINKLEEKEATIKQLLNDKLENKVKIKLLLVELKDKNKKKEGVQDICKEYIMLNNNINNIDTQIRELQETLNINFIITKEKEYLVENPPEVPKEQNNLSESVLNVEELSIQENDLSQIKQLQENDPEEISYYNNKPEIDLTDEQIPLQPDLTLKKKELKKKLLKPSKKAKKLKILKILKGKNTIEQNTPVKESNIKADVYSKDGKKRKKVGGVAVTEGNCIFPFKNGKKYVMEEDGCIEGKTGDWCATSVNKDNDYKMESFGYCK